MVSSISHAGGQHAASNGLRREMFLTRHHFLLIRPSADGLGVSHHHIMRPATVAVTAYVVAVRANPTHPSALDADLLLG